MVETDLSIVYVISFGCFVFGIVSAYLIYQHVKEEKAIYYKDKLRREQMKKDPVNYDLVTPTKKKKKDPLMPIVGAEDNVNEHRPSSQNVPAPAPLVAPVVLPPIPQPEPAAPAPAPDTIPLLESNPAPQPAPAPAPAPENSVAAPVAAAVLGGAVGAGAAVAVNQISSKPEPEKAPTEEPKKKEKKSKKPKEPKEETEGDFDDYRNFSPTILPPPKGAPPPQANYTPSMQAPPMEMPPPPPPYNNIQSIEVENRSQKPSRQERTMPQVSVVNRDGLLF